MKTFKKGSLILYVTFSRYDVNGNPLYHLTPTMSTSAQYRRFFFQNKEIPLYRRYASKNYALIQSYNIDVDAQHVLDEWDRLLKESNLAY